MCSALQLCPQRGQGPRRPRPTGKRPRGALPAFPGVCRVFPSVTISAPPGLRTGRKKRGAFLLAEVEIPVLGGSRAGAPASHTAAATRRKSLLGLDLLGEGTGAVCSLGREEPSVPGSGRLAGEPADLPRALRGRESHTQDEESPTFCVVGRLWGNKTMPKNSNTSALWGSV